MYFIVSIKSIYDILAWVSISIILKVSRIKMPAPLAVNTIVKCYLVVDHCGPSSIHCLKGGDMIFLLSMGCPLMEVSGIAVSKNIQWTLTLWCQYISFCSNAWSSFKGSSLQASVLFSDSPMFNWSHSAVIWPPKLPLCDLHHVWSFLIIFCVVGCHPDLVNWVLLEVHN